MRFVPSGIPELDLVLGGGIPEGDVVLVFGPPGSGKTTFALQHAFHAAAQGRPAVFVSTLSEPASRLVGHLRTFSFWDPEVLGEQIHLESIHPLIWQGVDVVTDAILKSVESHGARLLILDGWSTVRHAEPSAATLRTFLSELSTRLAALACTTLVTSSEVPDLRGSTPPELTMCDALLELAQRDAPAPAARTARVWKVRGAAPRLGEHALRIDGDGLRVFPRVETRPLPAAVAPRDRRLSTGSAELDVMMGGGLPEGGATVVAGAPGTGKTLLGLQYLMDGAAHDEPGLFLGFREAPKRLEAKARALGMDLEDARRRGLVELHRPLPIDIVADEVLGSVWQAIARSGATRLVIDGVAELEDAIEPPARRRSVMTALAELLRGHRVTALVTRVTSQSVGPELDLADSPLEGLAENLILLRYVEYDAELVRIVSVSRMRESAHDRTIRQYEIDGDGIHVRSRIETADGLLTGIARLRSERRVKRGRPTSGEGGG